MTIKNILLDTSNEVLLLDNNKPRLYTVISANNILKPTDSFMFYN